MRVECGANLYLDGSIYMVTMRLTGILKKAGDYYVALCLELNVSSQGKASKKPKECLRRHAENMCLTWENRLTGEIQSVPLEVLREFLIEDVEYVRPSYDWAYSENITFEVEAVA